LPARFALPLQERKDRLNAGLPQRFDERYGCSAAPRAARV